MNDFVKNLDEQIKIDKEIIELSPKSGVKQIKEFKKKLEEMLKYYKDIENAAMEEIETRYERINSIIVNEEIQYTSKDIVELDNLVLSEKGKNSFEIMDLDRLLYRIGGYYKKNLMIINKDIIECIIKFKEVGINLTEKDFQISEFANEYMAVLLEEYKKGDINSDRIKEHFEKVYWKSSNLIIHILVNIRQLFDENEAIIDKYYKSKTEKILNALNLTEEKVQDKKNELIKKLNLLRSVDGRLILDSFINGTNNIDDYKKDTYLNIYEKLVSKPVSELDEEQKKFMDENFKKLNNNLDEYINFLEFKFIFDEILNLKNVKENVDTTNTDKKGNTKKLTNIQIIKNSIKQVSLDIKKINEQIVKKQTKKFGLFKLKKSSTSNVEELVLERDKKILELKDLYNKLGDAELIEKVNENITNTTKIYDVLRFATYNYRFLAQTIIKKYPDIVEEDINNMIERFIAFIRLSNFDVLNNINISDKNDIAVVIKDKHKLLGVDISKESFGETNIEDFVKQVKIINRFNDIEKSNITLKKINFIINAKKVLKK